jgi:hypothetical protein
VALISSTSHPDLGAIKRSIESNVQRKVTILNPNQIKLLTDYNVLILYQPTVAFKNIFELNAKAKINTWIITGNDTDFNFLNQNQNSFTFKSSGQKEDYCQMQHVDDFYFKSDFNTMSTVYHCHNLDFNHIKKDDCDLILILRRDMFAACLSMYIAQNVSNIYTIDSTVHKENKDKFNLILQSVIQSGIDINLTKWRDLVKKLNGYWIYDTSNLKKFYDNVHIIYYEDFENNINYVNEILDIPATTIPKELLTERLPYSKWDLINNKKEVIDIFYQNSNEIIPNFYLINEDNPI